MQVTARPYCGDLISDWNKVLVESKNGLFQFDRGFIEYHGERFEDLSSIAYIDDNPVALFPLARIPSTGEVVSHPGLTFGGVVLRSDIRSTQAIVAINTLLNYSRDCGLKKLTIKLVPHIFSRYPSGELEFALWRRGFTITRRDLSSVLPLTDAMDFNTSKRQAIARATKLGVSLAPTQPHEFHKLLSEVLQTRHEAQPVHSVAELNLLATRFPQNIRTYAAWLGSELVAGSMVFRYGHVWHTQYMACSERGRQCGALDLVVDSIKQAAINSGAKYLSFGASTESAGSVLNEGLLWQKESFGARSITHDFMSGAL